MQVNSLNNCPSLINFFFQVKISLTVKNIGGWMIFIHKKNHLVLDAEDLYGGFSKYHMTKNNLWSPAAQSVVAENLASDSTIAHDNLIVI